MLTYTHKFILHISKLKGTFPAINRHSRFDALKATYGTTSLSRKQKIIFIKIPVF